MRSRRLVVPNCAHHVTHRGNRKTDIFRDDSDRLVYLRLIHDACVTHQVAVLAYCLMCNHVHWILVPEDEKGLSLAIQQAHGEYGAYFNAKYNLVGHVWQARFKSVVLDDNHCYNAIRYVERNPVTAGLVTHAEHYPWSSAAAHCGLREDPLLTGKVAFFEEIEDWSAWLSTSMTEAEIQLLRRNTRTGRPLGSDEFIQQLELLTGRRLRPKRQGRPPKPQVPEGLVQQAKLIG